MELIQPRLLLTFLCVLFYAMTLASPGEADEPVKHKNYAETNQNVKETEGELPPRHNEGDAPPRHDERDAPPRHDERDAPPGHDEGELPPRHDVGDAPPRHDEGELPPRHELLERDMGMEEGGGTEVESSPPPKPLKNSELFPLPNAGKAFPPPKAKDPDAVYHEVHPLENAHPDSPDSPDLLAQRPRGPKDVKEAPHLDANNDADINNNPRRHRNLPPDERQGGRPPHKRLEAGNPGSSRIAVHAACQDDVQRICSDANLNLNNNFAVLDCLQRDRRDGQDLSEKCHHFIWSYKRNLTTDERFDSAAFEVCKPALEKLPECQSQNKGTGTVISCLIEHIDNVTVEQCHQFLQKMEAIVFSDFRLVNKFMEKCKKEIDDEMCGRLPSLDDGKTAHKQGETIACLQKKVNNLERECRKEILRISELQADDYHLDRPLYFACRDDRERFCERIMAGHGLVYKCLIRHKFDAEMSSACRTELIRRQTLVHEDWKVSHGLVHNCRADIKKNQCLNQKRTEATNFKHGKLSVMLLCLESAMHMGGQVSQECQAELLDLRRQLMEDYSITPEIAKECSLEITEQCAGGLHKKGKTLHCLMDLMKVGKKFKTRDGSEMAASEACKKEMNALMKEADVGSDFRIDAMLMEACQPVVETSCHDIRPGDARIITCLLEKMDTDKMVDECEERLLEIQYFITRDWKMDPRIYRKCRKDATSLCFAAEAWKDMDPAMNVPDDKKAHHGYVMACLFRHVDNHKDNHLSHQCATELRRAMHSRAVSVHLQPEVEDPCMLDLGKLCSENVEKGMEMDCLQDHFEKLTEECQEAVKTVTEREAEDIELDRLLVKACSPVMTRYCNELVENSVQDEGQVMECLIKHKNELEMNEKCKAGVVHYQLISMKTLTFNYKFKTLCKADVMRYCKGIKNKSQAVTCLSEHVRNDTFFDKEHRITENCRQQLRVDLLQRNEDARLDPELLKSCQADIDVFCKVDFGNSRKIKCLRQNRKHLKPECHRVLFNRDKDLAKDNSIDFSLNTMCKAMIDQYCQGYETSNTLECLKLQLDNIHFDSRCRKIVLDRLRTQKLDFRIAPRLERACEQDIHKYCNKVLQPGAKSEMEGVVIKCLKKQFSVPKRLSDACAKEIKIVIEEAQKDVKQAPVLYMACENDIKFLCQEFSLNEGMGKIEECLKNRMEEIRSNKCKREVADLLQETKVDIEVDPILHKACASDLLQYCPDIPAGEGQQMACILAALEDSNIAPHLTKDCKLKLSKRKEMWELAARVAPPETLGEVAESIQISPSRNYFLVTLFGFLAVIFLAGLLCGRVTKRLHQQVKDR